MIWRNDCYVINTCYVLQIISVMKKLQLSGKPETSNFTHMMPSRNRIYSYSYPKIKTRIIKKESFSRVFKSGRDALEFGLI